MEPMSIPTATSAIRGDNSLRQSPMTWSLYRGRRLGSLPDFPTPLSTTAMGVSVAKGVRPQCDTDFDYAAVACVWASWVLPGNPDPAAGHRQSFQMIITDAELESIRYWKHRSAPAATPASTPARWAHSARTRPSPARSAAKRSKWPRSTSSCARMPQRRDGQPLHPTGKPDPLCGICNRTCLAELEKRGIGEMKRAFRTRSPEEESPRRSA